MKSDDSHYRTPVGVYGEQVIIQTTPSKQPAADTEGWKYSLWDPATNTFTPAWSDAPGLQETYMQSDGDWIETVTRGFGGTAPMADWTLILRNPRTGEARAIAQAQPGQGEINLTRITLQDDPHPSLDGGKLVWQAAELLDGDGVQSTVFLYDIASSTTTTLEIKTDHAREDLWSPSIGGGKVAWLDGDGTDFKIIILELASGRRITLGTDATVRETNLTKDGRYLLIEGGDEGGAYYKQLIEVGTGDRQLIAHAQGVGVFATTRYVSWDSATISGGSAPAGFFDLQTHELRLINSTHDLQTNVAHVMGRWFAWQEMPLIGPEAAAYYFAPLPD